MGEVIPVKLWDKKDAAKFLGTTPSWVEKAARKKHLPGLKVGKEWRFVPERLQRWAEDHSASGPKKKPH